jgi:uncharacterized protein (DUF2252 family)
MAADLATTPATGASVQACGDCHLMNFGAFATPERRLIFDINDFDETSPAPWEWDIKRLAASFVIAGRNNRFSKEDAYRGALHCVRSYRERMAQFSEMTVLDRWYEKIEMDDLVKLLLDRETKKRIRKRIKKTAGRSVVEDDFPKLTEGKGAEAKIKDNPPLIYHPKEWSKIESQNINSAFKKYYETLSEDRKVLLDHYKMSDLAIKVVGVGSVGTRCGILLLMAGDDDPLFLQVKEARVSVLEPYAGKSKYRNRGERVVAGQRLMQSASDIFLGWTEGQDNRHFYVRQLRDMKIKPLVEILEEDVMANYAEFCGWALARAHAKSGNPSLITGYLGNNETFDEAIADFAVSYADQNERDHALLLNAIREGKIEVYQEN